MENIVRIFVVICRDTLARVEEVSEWDIKGIELCDDYGEPYFDPDVPTGYSYVPEDYHEEMSMLSTAKYYKCTFKYLNEEIPFDQMVRMQNYIKAYNYTYPKKRGTIRTGR